MSTKPTDSQKLEILYKKYLGYPDAYPGTNPSVEAIGSARQKVFSSLQILSQSVPTTAPSVLTVDNTFAGGSNIRYTNIDYPYIVKYVKLPLMTVKPNTSFTYSYTGLPNLLTNIIPTNYDPIGTYIIYVYINDILVSADKWVLDVDAGYITFFDADVTQSVAISFWRYEGEVGLNNWVGDIIPPTKGGTGVNNGTNTITLGGNLTTSGNHTTTLTTTANTNVTLPTSGTLLSVSSPLTPGSIPYVDSNGNLTQNNSGLYYSGTNLNTNNLDTSSYGSIITNAVSTWTNSTSGTVNNTWKSVCWAPELGIFCTVSSTGSNNRVMTSVDGITWTTQTTSGIDNTWNSICWAPELGIFCAVASTGSNNRVMTSPDGITWTSRTSAANNNWNSVCWAPDLGIFCAVASTGSNNRVMTSPDGISWSTQTTTNNTWRSVCWSQELGLFCSVAYAVNGVHGFMTSPDGITWTTKTVYGHYWTSVCWSPELGIFCAIGSGLTPNIMISSDGITWTSISCNTSTWNSICWSSELGIFCAVATTVSGTNAVMTSPDGITWTYITPSGNYLNSVCWSPELGVFCVVSDGNLTNSVMISTKTVGRYYYNPLYNSKSSLIQINSTNKGLLLPCLSNTQIENINTPQKGLVVYNIEDRSPKINTGYSWNDILTSQPNGNVGIGTYTPVAKLHVIQTSTLGVDSFRVDDELNDTTYFKITENGNVGISTPSPDVSSILDITSTTKGLLPPRMTSTQRDAITTPASGLTIYNNSTDKKCLSVYNGTLWNDIAVQGASVATSQLTGQVSGANGGTGVDNTGKTITLGGNLTTSGAFTTTINTTANTNVTLPTSGTLAVQGANVDTSQLIGVVLPSKGGTGVDNGSKTITLGGNLTTSGAFNTTINTTANTNVTLPTSGTLVSVPSVLTNGSIPFADSSSQLSQNNSQLFWNNNTTSLGIGTASPSAKLHIVHPTDSTGDILRVDDETNDSTRFVIDQSGNVGVGITTPTFKLHVNGETESNKYATSALFSNNTTRPAISSTLIDGEIHSYGCAGGNTLTTTADDGFLRLSAGGGSNGTQKSFIDLSGFSDTADMNKNITLGTSGVERMRIDNSGNVGVGTSTPTAKLHVVGTSILGTATATSINKLTLTEPASSATLTLADGSSLATSGAFNTTLTSTATTNVTLPTSGTLVSVPSVLTNGSIPFSDSSSQLSQNNSQLFWNNNTTSLGIGTSSPSAKLHIVQEDAINSFRIDDVLNDTTSFIVDQSGNVGVGITTPSLFKLHVNGETESNKYATSALFNNGTSRPALSTTPINGEIHSYGCAGGNTLTTTADDGFLRLSAGGGANIDQKSFIDLSGFSDTVDMNKNITLGTSGVERMRIDNSGNVGVGTSTPTAKLHVVGTSILGTATATSINKLTLTEPSSSATLTLADGSSLATSGAFNTTLTSTATTNVTLPTTGTLATRDQNLTTTVSSGGTLTLVASDRYIQRITGTTTHTVVLPVVSTLLIGHSYCIINDSSGNVIINSSGGNLVTTLSTGVTAIVICTNLTGTTEASWTLSNKYITSNQITDIDCRNLAASRWTVGATQSVSNWYYATDFIQNGLPTENVIEYGMDMYDRPAILWSCKNKDNSDTLSEGPDGGWNITFPVSDTKNYISIVYMKRVGTPNSGLFYHGTLAGSTLTMTGADPGLSYFIDGFGIASLPQDVWCISIGLIYGKNHPSTTNSTFGGIYRLDTGVRLATSTSYKMKNGATTQMHRAYLYYSTPDTNGVVLQFWNPQFYEINGNETSLTNMFNTIKTNASGNVGIGTTAPSAKLHISGASVDSTITDISGHSLAGIYKALAFQNNGRLWYVGEGQKPSSTQDFSLLSSDTGSGNLPVNHLSFDCLTNNLFLSGSQTITSNLGIGTTAPSAKLHIVQPTASTGDILRVDDQSDDSTPFIIKEDGAVGIGTTAPNASAILDITSTTKGVLVPRMNSTDMTGISGAVQGLLVYNTADNVFAYYNGTTWVYIIPSNSSSKFTAGSVPFSNSSGYLTQNNSQLFWDNTNNRLGVGTTAPVSKLHLSYIGSVLPSGGTDDNIVSADITPPMSLVMQDTRNYEGTSHEFNRGVHWIFNSDQANRYTGAGATLKNLSAISMAYHPFGSYTADSLQGASNIMFYTTGPHATLNQPEFSEKMRILYNGNVGIGTTAPRKQLDVFNSGCIGTPDDITTASFSVGSGILQYPQPPNGLSSNTTVISGQTYANGTYITSASSVGGSNAAWKAFDKNPSNYWVSTGSLSTPYNDAGEYIGTNSTTYNTIITYPGEWIQIQLPTAVMMKSFSLTSVNFSTHRTPQDFIILGSNDGTMWTSVSSLITNQTFTQAQTISYNTFTNSTRYLYYRLAINKRRALTGGYVDLAEWRIYGYQNTANPLTVLPENVGIGTNNPLAKLHIVQTGSDDAFRVDDEENDLTFFRIDSTGQSIFRQQTNGVYQNVIRVVTATNASNAIRLSVSSTGNGVIDLLHSDNTTVGCAITGNTSGSSFFLGNVGIGTTTPDAKLHIVQPTASTGDILRVDDETNDTTYFRISDNGTAQFNGGWIYLQNAHLATNGNDLYVRANNSYVNIQPNVDASFLSSFAPNFISLADNAVHIDSSKNVGIGTTSPQKQLDVFNSACIGSPTPGSNSVFAIGSGINQYPPSALSANVTTISGQNYANGSYTASASSTVTFDPWRAFDKNTTTYWLSGNFYSGSDYTGAMTTTYNTTLTYAGEWIQIQLPTAVIMKSFTLTAVSFTNPQNPRDFAVFGSNNGSTWTLVSTLITGEDFINGQTKTYTTTNTTAYTYYRLAVNKRNGTIGNYINLAEWRIYGYQNGTTNTLTTTIEGNVGIGTTSPAATLEVSRTASSAITPYFQVTQSADTAITALTEAPSVRFNLSSTRTWANGNITKQRFMLVNAPTIAFSSSASTVTDTATVSIEGAPIKGTNATLTNTHGLLIEAGAVSTAGSSYGLTCNAQTGATNNYAAAFLGGNVGIGTTSPSSRLHINQSVAGNATTTYLAFNEAKCTIGTDNANNFIIIQDNNLEMLHTTPLTYGNEATPRFASCWNDTITNASNTSTITALHSCVNRVRHLSSGTITNAVGCFTISENNSSGTIATNYGSLIHAYNTSSGLITSNLGQVIRARKTGIGSITTNTGLLVDTQNNNVNGSIDTNYVLRVSGVNSGTITNHRMIQIDAPTTGITNNYVLYCSDNVQSYLEGNLGISTAVPGAKIHISSPDASTKFIRCSSTALNNTGTMDVIFQVETDSDGAGVMSLQNRFSNNLADVVRIHSNGTTYFNGGSVGIGTNTPNSSAILDITSTTKGFLPPRMTTTERNAISSPAEGLIAYNTTEKTISYRDNIAWRDAITKDCRNLASNKWTVGATQTLTNWYYATALDNVGSTNENVIEYGMDPYDRPAILWSCKNKDEIAFTGDGGWNLTIPVNENKNYISIIYIKRVGTPDNGVFYHGCGYDPMSTTMNGADPGNAYFAEFGISSLPQDVWCVSIGLIYGSSHPATTNSSFGGIYRLDTGVRLSTPPSFKMKSGTTIQLHRAFLYYSNPDNNGVILQMWNPQFYEINGNEASLITEFNSVKTNYLGNVGIGTSAPTSRLHIEGNTRLNGNVNIKNALLSSNTNDLFINASGGNAVTIRNTADVSTFQSVFDPNFVSLYADALYINSSNNIGIGTTTPLSKLSITPSTVGAKITLYDNASTTNHYGFGVSASQLNYHVSESANNHVFYAGGKNGNGTELMRIKGTGNVGIGTSTPEASALHIKGGGQALILESLGATSHVYMGFYSKGISNPRSAYIGYGGDNTNDMTIMNEISGGKLYIGSSGSVSITLDGQNIVFGTSGTERMRIDNLGCIGIGTSTPVSVLNLKYIDNITSSYQYPPIGMTSASQTVTGMDFYFNGTYTVTVSSNFAQSPGTYNQYTGVAYGPFSASGDLLAWFCLSSRYTTTTVGTYTGTNSITNVSGSQTTISGEWIKLKIPSNIVLTSYKLTATYTFDSTGTPRTWAILGSNDGTNWDTLDNRLSSPLVPLIGTYNDGNPFTVTNTNAYTYFAFIVNTTNNVSNGSNFGVAQLELYGSPKSPAFLVENEATETFQPFIIDYKGNVGIGIPSPLYTLHLSTDRAAKTASTTWTVTSDQRLKENILKADLDICYNNVKNITLHRFRYRDDLFNHNQIHDRSRLGWIAQEVEFLFPKAVTKQSQYGYDDCRSLDVDQLYASMYGCVQKLIEYNETNINRITDLENNYNLLKSENEEKNLKIIELENKIVNIEMQYELLLSKLKVVIPDF